MVGITAALAAIFSVAGLIFRPGFALGLVILTMLVWPEYLRVPMGIMQMSVPRIVALLLFTKLVMSKRWRIFKFNKVDFFVFIGWVWIIFANILGGAETSEITRQIGRGLDTVLIYMVARLALQSSEDLKSLLLPLAGTAIIMGGLGAMEAVTSYSPYQKLDSLRSWVFVQKVEEYRLGFLRAKASTSVHIYFGLSMAIITGILWSLRGYGKLGGLFPIAMIMGILGTLSSMSSGPWISRAAFIFFNLFALKPSLIKPGLWGLMALFIFIELASNRHFYNLVDYIALNSHTAWYRTRLLEVAFEQLHEFWLFGVAGDWPHHWGGILDGRGHVDVVNQFLIVGLYGGLLAMYFYIASHYYAVKKCILYWKKSKSELDRKVIFTLISLMLGIDVASMSVGLFGPPIMLLYLFQGMMVSITEPSFRSIKTKTIQINKGEETPDSRVRISG